MGTATPQLITAPNGYLVYKVGDKDTLPLGHVRDEIASALQSQRMQDAMQAIQGSANPTLNENYFTAAADAQRGHPPMTDTPQPTAKPPESGPK